MTKLLVFDHNALDPANRKLYDKIVRHGGIDLRLIVPSHWHNNYTMLTFTPPSENPEYEIYSSGVLFSTRTHRLIYLSLKKHLNEFRPDVLFMHSEPENFSALEAALVAPTSTKTVFFTHRNVDHRSIGYPYRLQSVHRWIETFVLSRTNHIIASNASARKLFVNQDFGRVDMIPLGVDTEMFSPRAKDTHRDFVIGYVGRIVPEKGVDLILHSLSQFPDHVKGLIVGNGNDKSNMMNLARELGLVHRVKFVDAVSPSELPSLYAQMDCVVLPSRSTQQWTEQFGRVLIEGMASGIPVIGSTSGEIPNVIGNAGLIFKENSVEGLSLAIEKLLASSVLRSALQEGGQQRVRRLYSLEVVAAQYNRLFRSLS